MPGVKFVIGADAAQGVQEFLRMQVAEKKVADGLKDVVTNAKAAGGAMSASARQGLKEYEMAEKAISRSMPSQGRMVAGGGYVRASRGTAALDVVPIASRLLRPGAATIQPSSGGGELRLARTEAEQFTRFMQAQQLRSQRNEGRLLESNYLSSVGRADGNLYRGGSLLDQGNRALAASSTRRAGAWDADMNQRGLDQTISMNNMETRLAMKQQGRDKAFQAAGAGLAVITGAVMELNEVTQRYTQYVTEAGAAGVQFEGEIRGLMSLGDNTNRSGSIRSDILAKSGAYGIDTGTVANANFMLNSAASNLGAKTQGDIMNAGIGLNQVAGGDLQAELIAVTKLMQTYGTQMGSADMAASKLLATEDKAAITLEELAQLLPDVLPAAKLMGHTYDEVAASVITATQVLGTNDKTLTGLRNTFLKLGEAQEKGLVSQGTFIEQIEQLGKVAPPELEKIFGERTVSIVAALADHVGDLKDHLKEMSEIKASGVMQKFLDEQKDPNRRDADTIKSEDQTLKNIPALRFENPDIRDADMRLKAAKIGYEAGETPLHAAITPDWAKNIALATAAKDSVVNKNNANQDSDWVQAGFTKLIGDKVAAGDAQSLFEANTMRLQFGSETNTQINGYATGAKEAQEYTDLSRRLGGDVGLGRYEAYRQDELAGNKQGMDRDVQSMKDAIKLAAESLAKSAADHKDAAADQKKAAADNQRGSRDRNAHNY